MDKDQTAADIGKLQAELAFQSDTVQGLNDALATQQQDILLLQRQVALLGEQLRALRENGNDSQTSGESAVEKPPHY